MYDFEFHDKLDDRKYEIRDELYNKVKPHLDRVSEYLDNIEDEEKRLNLLIKLLPYITNKC